MRRLTKEALAYRLIYLSALLVLRLQRYEADFTQMYAPLKSIEGHKIVANHVNKSHIHLFINKLYTIKILKKSLFIS